MPRRLFCFRTGERHGQTQTRKRRRREGRQARTRQQGQQRQFREKRQKLPDDLLRRIAQESYTDPLYLEGNVDTIKNWRLVNKLAKKDADEHLNSIHPQERNDLEAYLDEQNMYEDQAGMLGPSFTGAEQLESDEWRRATARKLQALGNKKQTAAVPRVALASRMQKARSDREERRMWDIYNAYVCSHREPPQICRSYCGMYGRVIV